MEGYEGRIVNYRCKHGGKSHENVSDSQGKESVAERGSGDLRYNAVRPSQVL